MVQSKHVQGAIAAAAAAAASAAAATTAASAAAAAAENGIRDFYARRRPEPAVRQVQLLQTPVDTQHFTDIQPPPRSPSPFHASDRFSRVTFRVSPVASAPAQGLKRRSLFASHLERFWR